jgi:hypothetical protein
LAHGFILLNRRFGFLAGATFFVEEAALLLRLVERGRVVLVVVLAAVAALGVVFYLE